MDERIDPTAENTGAAKAAPEADVVRERGVVTKIQQAGLELAKTVEVEPTGGGVWTVEDCIVNFPRKEGTCKAFRKSRPRTRCTHWWAVAYTIDPPTPEELAVPATSSEVARPASSPLVTVTTLPSSEELGERTRARLEGGYTRYAADYDRFLRKEYRDTMFFLRPFLQNVAPALDVREKNVRGRKFMPLWLLLFEALVHAHHNWSFRRTEGVLEFMADLGFLPRLPGFNVVDKFVRSHETTPVLRDLLALTADPFREYGPMTIAADGTGASSNRFDDWRVEGKGHIETRETRRWYKAHAACDVDTLSVVAVYVTNKDVSEKRVLIDRIIPELVVRDYNVEKFLADGGYNATEIVS